MMTVRLLIFSPAALDVTCRGSTADEVVLPVDKLTISIYDQFIYFG